jgi:hypothetical protein
MVLEIHPKVSSEGAHIGRTTGCNSNLSLLIFIRPILSVVGRILGTEKSSLVHQNLTVDSTDILAVSLIYIRGTHIPHSTLDYH